MSISRRVGSSSSAVCHVLREGPQVLIGGNETYTALCRRHWALDEALPPDLR